jgi:alkanesulfonate monooxygenase SsuD/methylene tetrahydromethanopterin reductase-like flavin-dependent oxidoreductase (luciferase family)
VRVGLYLDLRNPPAWRTSPPRLYGFALELCEEFERLGGDSIWVTEHHVFDDDYLPQPLTFAAAIAARTSRVRIGTGILIAPLHRPVEIAEQAAVVDILSDGRLDLGIGAGYRVPEYELYGADIATRYRATDATARELRRLWGPDGATPRPVQERLPIWLGYQGPKGARRAGVLGENLLTANQASWPAYRDDAIAEGPITIHVERRRAVAGEFVQLDERTFVQQRVDALTGRLLAAGVLLLDGAGRARMDRLVVTPFQIGELAGGGMRIGSLRKWRSCHG